MQRLSDQVGAGVSCPGSRRHLSSVPLVALLFAFALLGGSRPARAYFDIVSLYQQKVKQFEAVYYLEKDREWHRDRRVFELFTSFDHILSKSQDDESELPSYTNLSGGLIVNVRPGDSGQVQLSIFSLWSGNQMFSEGLRIWEGLHGGRLTLGDYSEASLGAYWVSQDEADSASDWDASGPTQRASWFLELNSPRFWLKSSCVLPQKTDESVERWDLRFDYDQFPWVESLTAGYVQYNFGEKRGMVLLDVLRLGVPSFRFFSADTRISSSGIAWVRGGLDMLFQFEEDFNLTRRGHFATSLGLQARYSYTSPDGAAIVGRSSDDGVHGAQVKFTAQIPAKWLLTALVIFGAAYTGSYEDQQRAAAMLTNTIEEPRDILFCRIEFEYTYNSPESFMFPVPDIVDRHRLFVTLGFTY